MPTFNSLLSRPQSPPGQVNNPNVAGGPPTASDPNTSVAPPGVATSTIGRPPLPGPTFGGEAGSKPLPVGPPQPWVPPGAGRAGPGPGRAKPPMPGSAQPNAIRPGTPGAPTPPNMASGSAAGPGIQQSVTATPLQVQLDHVPDAAERSGLPPGVSIVTPYGSMDSQGNLALSPEGEVKYQQATVKARRTFGPHPWADDPMAPPAPVKIGRRNFNPFTGQWTRS